MNIGILIPPFRQGRKPYKTQKNLIHKEQTFIHSLGKVTNQNQTIYFLIFTKHIYRAKTFNGQQTQRTMLELYRNQDQKLMFFPVKKKIASGN